jgi:queuine tRNA-ribosyltransferase
MEAEALYVRQLQLELRMRAEPDEFVVWDVGLGGGANVLTVLDRTRGAGRRLRIVSFDHTLAPLEFALIHAGELGYFAGYEAQAARLIHQRSIEFTDAGRQIRWELRLGDFPALLSRPDGWDLPPPHAVLFDAYSPARNPAMWTLPLFEQLFHRLDPQRPCALPTYSRSTLLRVTLLLAGFHVGVGQATGEKEETTIAGNTGELVAEPLGLDWLRRALASTSAEPLSEPSYRQAALSPESRMRLLRHPQFRHLDTAGLRSRPDTIAKRAIVAPGGA